MKFYIAFLGCVEKHNLLKTDYKSLAVETPSGILDISIFWWLNRFLISGTRDVFSLDDLEDVKQSFRLNVLGISVEVSWLDGVF
jgi:hypothetical protein